MKQIQHFLIYLYMRCYKQPPFPIPEPISNIWETIVDLNTWEQISLARKITRSTFSWVVRYCVFNLLHNPRKLETLAGEIPSMRCARANGHRLKLCLYGEDENTLRLIAYKMQISVSSLIRLAIQLHIHRLLRPRKTYRRLLIARGLKMIRFSKNHFEWKNGLLRSLAVDFHSYSNGFPLKL